MACTQKGNIEKNRLGKRSGYRKLAFKIREGRLGFKVKLCQY